MQGGDVGPQVPERESAVLSGWCLHPRRHTTRTSTAPFCCRWSAVGPQDKYQHQPMSVPLLLWTSYVERPASLSTYRQQSSDTFGRALKRHLFSIWCRLQLFALQHLLMWRIIKALIKWCEHSSAVYQLSVICLSCLYSFSVLSQSCFCHLCTWWLNQTEQLCNSNFYLLPAPLYCSDFMDMLRRLISCRIIIIIIYYYYYYVLVSNYFETLNIL